MQAALEPHPPRAIPHANLRAILGRAEFRHLLAARLLSQLGDGWFQGGLASSIFFNPDKAASPLAVATAFAVLLVPYSALGPFVGVFLDRWSRRNTLMVANSVRAVAALPAALFVWHAYAGAWFVLSALLVVALNRFCLSGLSAAQPHVVDAERLVTANSFATTFGSVVYALGLGSAGMIFRTVGTSEHTYAVVAATAAVAYALSATVTRIYFAEAALGPDHAVTAHSSVLVALVQTAKGMVSGFRHLVHRRGASTVLVVNAVQRGLYGLMAITVLLLYRNFYHSGDAAASMTGLVPVAAAGAAGSTVAALVTPRITRRVGGWRWVAVMIGALAVLVPAFGLPYLPAFTVAAAFLVSLASQGVKIVTDTTLQVEIDDDYRGRVFSVNDTALNLLFVVGIFAGAAALPADGHGPLVMACVGVGYAILTAWYVMAAPRRPHPAILA